jgi:hypothetical protein
MRHRSPVRVIESGLGRGRRPAKKRGGGDGACTCVHRLSAGAGSR